MYRNKKVGVMFVMPMVLMILIFLTYPFIQNIFDSFFDFDNRTLQRLDFIMFENYRKLFASAHFHNALINTLILMILVIIFQVGLALLLALLVSYVSRLQTFYKVSYFIPIIISASALGLMFQMFYRHSPSVESQGALNQLLIMLNFEPIEWISANAGRNLVFFAVSLPVIWQYIGFYFVIFLTGLTTISAELLEAASIDGATSFQKVMKIQIPMLQNIIRVVLVLAITGTLKVFDLPYILNPNNEPLRKNYLLGTLMQRLKTTSMGQAAAFAVVLVILGVLLSGVSNVLFKQNKDL